MFQKCGEILFAIKSEKIVVECNFCHLMFAQMQALVRHLRIEHSDVVGLVKPAEAEVYAIEELLGNSPDPQSDEDETDWLNEADMKWPKGGVVVPKNKSNGKGKEIAACNGSKDGSNATNNEEEDSIKEEQVSNYDDDTLWQTIQIEWKDGCTSAETDSQSFKYIENFNSRQILANTNKELGIKNSFVEQNLNEIEENKCQSFESLKRLMQDLENIDNVDTLLDSLENESSTPGEGDSDSCLQESETVSYENILNSNDESKDKRTIRTDNKETHLEYKFEGLEESLTIDTEKELINLNKLQANTETNICNNKPLNKDLTDVLVGQGERKKVLSKNVPDVLENDIELQLPHVTSSTNKLIAEDANVKAIKAKCDTINDKFSMKTSKYQQTNLTAKKRPLQQLNRRNPKILKQLRKESNSILPNKKVRFEQTPPLENHKGCILNHQQPHNNANSVKCPRKFFTLKNTNEIQTKQIRQNQTQNKENSVIDVQKFNLPKPTPNTSFINKERGCKLPITREELFYKQLQKAQKPTLKHNINPKGQEKGKIFNIQNTPLTETKQTVEFTNKKQLKQPLKHQEKSSESEQNYNLVLKTVKSKINPGQIEQAKLHEQAELNDAGSTHQHQHTMTATSTKAAKYSKQKFSPQPNFFEGQSEHKEGEIIKAENSLELSQPLSSINIIDNNDKIAKNYVTKTTHQYHLNRKSLAVHRSARKNQVLQRLRHIKKQIFKSLEESDSLVKFKNKQSPLLKHKKKPKIIIENVKILPSLDQTTLKPFIIPANNSTNSTEIWVRNPAQESSPTTMKTQTVSPFLEEDNFSKYQHISTGHKQNEEKKPSTELESTQLDLSESCVDFLQRNLKASRLNVESLLNTEMPEGEITSEEISTESSIDNEKLQDDVSLIINDLLEQVSNENPTAEVAPRENTAGGDKTIEVFDESKDLNLLDKIGLKIIKLPDIEDAVLLEERDEMHDKAKQFAAIYKNYYNIWSTKITDYLRFKKDLHTNFKSLTAETNTRFDLKLNMSEMKRLVNLINCWVAQSFCNRFIEKRKISDSINRYLAHFLYIPKTIKHFYYCEYCDEYANSEHKYNTHRITHTGALYPHECQKCCKHFKLLKLLKAHELSLCKDSNNVDVLNNRKCLVCEKIFTTDDLLYEHSKTHLKNIYRCAKCNKVFANEKDIKLHLNLCNNKENKCMREKAS